MPIVTKEVKANYCHLHEAWECYWINGLGEEVGTKDLAVGCCHTKVKGTKPWCSEHKPVD